MKNKKLVRNTIAVLSVVLMTTVMVLSSCGNTFDSEHANITIRLNGSGSGRAISDAEKSAATLNVYFNDSLVASNVSGTYNGTAVVGTTLKIRLDALVNGKRIARGEDTITVQAGTNNVAIKLNENREEIKPPVGSIIMKDGSYLTKEQITSENQADAVAVVYKAAGGKAWAVKTLGTYTYMWSLGEGANKKIDGLVTNVSGDSTTGYTFSGYTDGSNGLAILRDAVSDAEEDGTGDWGLTYPAWGGACSEGMTVSQNLPDNMKDGWYFPSIAEVYDIYKNRDVVDASLTAIGATAFGTNPQRSSSQHPDDDSQTFIMRFSGGTVDPGSKNSGSRVSSVRVFTY